jgi:hypothetical protein
MAEILFTELPEEEAKEVREAAGRGRKSSSVVYLKAFLDSGLSSAKMSRKSLPEKTNAAPFAGALNMFARKHKIPVLVKARGGEVYFFKLDPEELDIDESAQGTESGSEAV